MPLLTIHHKTEYRYARPVAFGEHRVMLSPLPGHDLRILATRLVIEPEPMSLRWIHDVFGNSVAIATFDERADTLTFTATSTVEHNPAEDFALTPDDHAFFYPFFYGDEEYPDLVQYITPQYGDPQGELSAWARQFLDAEAPTPTFKILSSMTHGIRKAFRYRKRHEHGTQHPLDTLQLKSGTCRDYAMFMIEALRRLGIAARFVSGYLFVPGTARTAMSAAAPPMPGCKSICRTQAGSNSTRPTASSAIAISCASLSRAIRARRSRCTAPISVRPTPFSGWTSTSTSFRSAMIHLREQSHRGNL